MTRRRRDPRAEALALTTSTEPRRRIARGTPPAAPPSGRRRRDPRAERAASSVQAGARLRYDRSGSGATLSQASTLETTTTGPAIRIVEDPAFLVLVVPDQPRGELTAHDRQLVAAGRVLADAGGGAVVVLAPDQATTTDFATAGADRLMKVDFELFTD